MGERDSRDGGDREGTGPLPDGRPVISIPSNAARHRLDEVGRMTEVPLPVTQGRDPTSPGIAIPPPQPSEPGAVPVFGDLPDDVVPAAYRDGEGAGQEALAVSDGSAPAPAWQPAHLRRTRRYRIGAVAGAAVVAGGVAVASISLSGSPGGNHAGAAGQHAALHPLAPAATQQATPTTQPPPTTTAPPPPFKLVSTTTGLTTYQLNGAAQITITASGACWVDIHQTNAGGAALYTATMQAGQTETVTGPAWVRLGAPRAVAITVGGSPVPAVTDGGPYDLEFQ